MELLQQGAGDLFRAIETSSELYALIAVFLWVFLEEAGVPLVPTADMVLIFAGWRVSQGQINPFTLVLVVVAATVLGSSVLYYISLRGGHPFLFKYGKYLHCPPSRLDRAERWVNTYRAPALMAGRMVPGLKTVVSIAAGVFEVQYRAFAVFTALAATIWAVSSLTIGRTFGPHIADLLSEAFKHQSVMAGIFATVVVGVVFYMYRRSRHQA